MTACRVCLAEFGKPSRLDRDWMAFLATLTATSTKEPENRTTKQRKVKSMLYTIAVVLIILWLLGLVTSYTIGGFIHILLVVAIIMILVNVISGRRML